MRCAGILRNRALAALWPLAPLAKAIRLRGRLLVPALCLLFLCLPPPPAADASALDELIASLEASQAFDPDQLAAVYNEAVSSSAGIDDAVARLRGWLQAAAPNPEGQAAVQLAIAHLQWRDGAIEDAVTSSDKALESAPTPETLLLKARLLDAGGEVEQAREWYQRAVEAFGEGEEQWLIRVRLAMMDVGPRSVEALEELAAQRDQSFRNQAAVVLALLGRPERAIALYEPLPEAGNLHRQHLRLSDWALKAEAHDLAREQAWLAYAVATVRADRLYALSLLAESYRAADELDVLLEDLAGRDAGDQELLRLRVETLIETRDYPQAIELYGQLEGSEADVAERRRLVALYEAAGDTGAMVREYRRMMDAEPSEPQWYDGLAAHYLNIADNSAALAVWKTLEERNAERAGVLVQAAGLMLAMGFTDESEAMIERHLAAYGPDFGALMFLFESRLQRGDDELALGVLARMEEFLPPDAAELVELADAYERVSRPAEALRVFEAIRDVRGELGYDEQMRLAWLYALVDRRRESLELWRDIWVGVESPARRSFAESQLLLLAAELGALGDMAVEMEGMLMAGTANRNHMNLLVRIYVESGDQLSATEIIDEYASGMGEDEIGHQQLLAQVYMLLQDYPAHDKALRRLYEIDPENRIDHIRSIILNLLTFDLATESNERFEEIQRWITELRAYDEESVTGEFEASVFTTAGFVDQAVEAYRRALVEQPENSDNLLLLADVMDNSGRTDEALAILQYFAENAVEDNDFVVAVDGVLNLIGTTTFFQQPDPDALDKLAWTKRVILERIARRANRFYLYELLADIAREQGDTEASFLALENSLAEAGLRRPAVLRELLTMATPNVGFGGFSTGAGDIDRQLNYGRRLLGLRQQLPPEVYIDVGKSLLAREDIAGAERAFEMINDITGMIDIDRTKGDMFEEAGYGEQARLFYNRALNVNRDSLELLHKTGFLYEAAGREDVAFERYLEAIGGLLRRQAVVLPSGARPVDPNSWQAITNQRTDTSVTREYREHYASLEQGLLLSWPQDAAESAAAQAELLALFEAELRNVQERAEEPLLPLARYARLDRSARLIRKVGFFLDDDRFAQSADRQLLKHFGGDATLVTRLAEVYGAAGRPLPDGATARGEEDARAALSPLRRQLELAEKREDFETQLQLLQLDGADEELEALLGERILDGGFRDGYGYALGLLDESQFRRLALATSSSLLEQPALLKELIGRDARLLLRAEEAAGQPLAPPERVIALLLDADTGEPPPSPFGPDASTGNWEYLVERASVDDRVLYLRNEAQRPPSGQVIYIRPFGALRAYRELLREELSDAQREDITDIAIGYLSNLDANDDNTLRTIPQVVLVLDALPSNTQVLYRITEYVENRWPGFPSLRPLLEAFYAERYEDAFRQLVEIEDNLPEQDGFPSRLFVDGLEEALKGPRTRLLDEIAAGNAVDSALARAAYEREFSSPFFFRSPTPERLERQSRVLDKLLLLDPDPSRYQADRINVWLSLGYVQRAGDAIAQLYDAGAGSDSWRLAHFLSLKSQQRFEEALAVAMDGGPDLSNADILQRALSAQVRGFGGMRAVISQLQAMQAPGAPSGATASVVFMPLAGGTAGGRKGPVQRLSDALNAQDDELGRQALREAWRSLLLPRSSPYGFPPGSMPVAALAGNLLNAPLPPPGQNSPASPASGLVGGAYILQRPATPMAIARGALEGPSTEPRLVMDAVAEASYGAAELDGFLRALPDRERRDFRPLYGYLADALDGGERMRELWTRLRAGEMNDHDLTLWMLLRDREQVEFAPGDIEAFEKRLAAFSADPAPYQLLLAARVFATAGAVAQAVDYYKLTAARRISHNEFGEPRRAFFFGQADPSLPNLLELIGEVAARLPPDAAREVVNAVLPLAQRADEHPGAALLFDAFALAALDQVYPPEELFGQLGRRYPSALELPKQLFSMGAVKAVELARGHAKAGNLDRGAEILGAMLMEEGPGPISQQELQDPQRFLASEATRALVQLYGLPAARQPYEYEQQEFDAAGEILTRLERLFPASADAWPDAAAWAAAATDTLLDWLESGQVHQDGVVKLLAPLGMRAIVDADPARRRELLDRILRSIDAGGRPLSGESLELLASLAQSGETSLPLELVADKLEQGRLPWQQQQTLLSMYQESEEGPQLLDLLRTAGLDRGLGVMRALRAIAEQSGDAAYASELGTRIKREQAAEKKLLPDAEATRQTAALLVP